MSDWCDRMLAARNAHPATGEQVFEREYMAQFWDEESPRDVQLRELVEAHVRACDAYDEQPLRAGVSLSDQASESVRFAVRSQHESISRAVALSYTTAEWRVMLARVRDWNRRNGR